LSKLNNIVALKFG